MGEPNDSLVGIDSLVVDFVPCIKSWCPPRIHTLTLKGLYFVLEYSFKLGKHLSLLGLPLRGLCTTMQD
jgi:hypothetical protein